MGEPDLFSLGMRKSNTYWALNSAKTKDEELDQVIDRIVSGLFSVMVTMGKKMRGPIAILDLANNNRCDADYTMSQRRCCRDDCCKA